MIPSTSLSRTRMIVVAVLALLAGIFVRPSRGLLTCNTKPTTARCRGTTPFSSATTTFCRDSFGHLDRRQRRRGDESTRLKMALSDSTMNNQFQQQQQQQDKQDDVFLSSCKALCEERNLPFEKIKNARDLATVRGSPIRPGRVYRMGRVGDASDRDIQLLLSQLNIQTMVDLRSPTELKDDPALMRKAVFGNFTNMLWKEEGRLKDGGLIELPPGQGPIKKRTVLDKIKGHLFRSSSSSSHHHHYDDDVVSYEDEEDVYCDLECQERNADQHRKERHFVSLMNEFKYVRGTAGKLRKRDITKTVLKSPGALVSRRVRNNIKLPFLNKINDGGLPMLNELLFFYGAPGIRYVLELVADRRRHPIAFYCTAGKDRTGALAAIILSLCGVTVEDIVEDYTLSANVYAEMNDHKAMVGALSQRNLDPKTFLGAPPHVMRDTMNVLQQEYGSVEGYCNAIGFGPDKQQQLREACMNE